MTDLIDGLFRKSFKSPLLDKGDDQAVFAAETERLAITTDSFVVSPLFFPGGDIGSLAVHGTLNDLAVGGARPLHLAVAFILEEGFPLADLNRIVVSMADAAHSAGAAIATGDTKVVERGKADGVFITTTGIGTLAKGLELGPHRIKPGDAVVVNGTVGDHGVAILSTRHGLAFETTIKTDSAPLSGLVETMLAAVPDLKAMRDPTRGGLAATLNEIASGCRLSIELSEADIPVQPAVKGACELLGLDPLHVANEGKLLAFCPAESVNSLVATMRAHPLGQLARQIGTVTDDPAAMVILETVFGGRRVIDWIAGEQLPRIC